MTFNKYASRKWLAGPAAAAILGLAGCTASNSQPGQKPHAKHDTRVWDQAQLDIALNRAAEHMRAGRLEQARGALAAYNDSTDVRPQLVLGKIDVEAGNYPAALDRLDAWRARCGAGTDSSLDARLGNAATVATFRELRGIACEGLRRISEAAAEYERAYLAEAGIARLIAWTESLAISGRTDDALALVERERERFPGDVEICELAARLWITNGEFGKAIAELRCGLTVDSGAMPLRRRLAEAYAANGDFAQATCEWRELLALSRDPAERVRITKTLGDCSMGAGDYPAAAALYKSVLLSAPSNAESRLGLALALTAPGAKSDSAEAERACDDIQGGDATCRLVAAVGYQRLNRPERALELLRGLAAEGEYPDVVPKLMARWGGR